MQVLKPAVKSIHEKLIHHSTFIGWTMINHKQSDLIR